MRTLPLIFLVACATDPAPKEVLLTRLTGEATWTWTFDDGGSCAYTRSMDGTEDRSAPWLAPAGTLFRVAVGLEEHRCAARVGVATGPALEHHGFDEVAWLRGGVDEPLFAQAFAAEGGWSHRSERVELGAEGGWYTVDASFQTRRGRGDVWHGYAPVASSACGWDLSSAPPYEGEHQLAEGAALPQVVLEDACGEAVSLRDLAGGDRYVVVDLAAMDCGPCQAMAEGEPGFRALLANEGIAVDTVTVLTPSLVEPWRATSVDDRAAWADAFGLHGPVLGDRSWGAVVWAEALGGELAYPSWAVVAPDRTVVAVRSGFRGWEEVAAVIRGDAARGR